MRLPALFACSIAFAVSACSSNFRRVTAPASDYADYRAVRVASSVPLRLQAAARYLDLHPDGSFHEEVADWFAKIERLFYEASADSPQGMQAYLAALPKGPHAANAQQRLDAFRDTAKAAAGERLVAMAAVFEKRLAAAAQSREDVLTAYSSWLRRLVDFDGWGRPLDEASDEVKKAWSEGPVPRCEPDRCTKLLEIPYELEVGGKPAPFECMIEISLQLSAGKVVGAVVSGPDLFARLNEANSAEPSARDDESRRHTVTFAATLTSGAIERRLQRVRCERDPSPRAVMRRECDGIRLEVFPKLTPEDDDRVVIHGPGGL
jgi:hypothetical protein